MKIQNLEQYCEFAGLTRKGAIISQKVKVPEWRKSQTGKNQERIGEIEIFIPIRYYNMKYAKYKCNDNYNNVIKWLQENAFEYGKPVYLPKKLGFRSYKHLLSEIDEINIDRKKLLKNT